MSSASDAIGRHGANHVTGRFRLETLEPRVLLSAELGGGLDLLSVRDHDEPVAGGLAVTLGAEATTSTGQADTAADIGEPARRELVFVDAAVDDYQALIEALRGDTTRDFEIHLIETGGDGLARIGAVLATHRDVDAVHLLTHGEDDALWLAGERLDEAALESRAAQVAGWRDHLSADADVLLYGCNLAGGESGRSLVARLAELSGADVAASDDATGSGLLGGDWTLEHQTGLIDTAVAFNDGIVAAWSGLLGASDPLWFSTKGDVSGSGVSGLANWDSSDLLAFGNPGLSLESPTTTGTLGFAQNWSSSAYNHDALHYVTADITVGSSAFQLKAGDLLLSGDAAVTLGGSDPSPDAGFSNSLGVNAEDIYVYRPATPGDYVSGSFTLLLDDPFGGGTDVTGVSLVESATPMGNLSLQAGDFLLLREGLGDEHRNVYLFDVTDVGAGSTSGATGLLIEGADLNFNALSGIELLESPLVIGARTLAAGTLLLSQDDSRAVGDNTVPVDKNDVFAVAPTQTTLGSGTSAGNVTPVFDGSDVNLNTGPEAIDAVTLTLGATTNTAPALAVVTPDLGTISEDVADSGAISVAALLAGYSDVDGGSRGVAITGSTVGGGSWEYSTDGSTWLALGAVAESNALLLDEADAVRFVPDGENGEMPTLTFRGWDETTGGVGGYVSILAPGGASAFSAATDTAKLDVSSVNDAPLAADALLAAIDEDSATPAGARIDTLLGAGFSDVDSADSFAGVAVTGNTASAVSQGAWQYSSDAGANWFDIGVVGDDAAALALDAGTRVRFVPVGDFNGTPISLSLRVLDSSYGGGFSTTALALETRVNINTSTPAATSVFSTAVNTVGTSVDAVNDDPTNAGTTPADQALSEETATTLDLSAIDLADVDAGTGAMTLTLSAASGTLAASSGGGVIVTGSGTASVTLDGTLANLNTFLDGASLSYTGATDVTGEDADTLAVLFNDKGNTGSGGGTDIALATVKVDIAAVNDAPLNTGTVPASVTLDEDTLTVLDLSAVTLADVDAGATPLSVTLSTAGGGTLSAASGGGVTVAGTGTDTLTLGGTLGALNTYLDAASVSFLGASNANGASVDAIAVSVNDNAGSGSVALGSVAVNLDAVNDDPTNAGTTPADQALSEETATPLDLSAIDLADVDAGTGAMTLTLSAASGTLAASSGGGVIVTGSGTASVTLDGTLANLNTFLDGASLSYTGATDVTGNDADTLAVLLNDKGNTGSGGGTDIALATVKVDIAAVNDAPLNTGTVPASVTLDEDTLTVLDLSAVTLADVDAGATPLSVTLSTAGGGTLSAASGGGVTVAGTGTDTLTLGGTLGALNTYLDAASVSFLGASNANGASADAIAVSVNDNAGSGSVALGSVAVDLDAVNDDPTNAGTTPADQALSEETATPLDLSAIDLADVDAGTGAMTLTLSAASGTLAASSGGGVIVTGSGAASVTLDGTLANLNTFLDGASLSYTGATDVTGNDADTLTVLLNDKGNTGSGGGSGGGTDIALATVKVDIAAVNDAPASTNSSLAAVANDNAAPQGAPIGILFGGGFSDPDTGASLAGVAVVANPANASSQGVWQYSSDASHWADIGAAADGPSALALDTTSRLRFVPVAGFVGSPDALAVRALDDSYAGGFSTTTAGVPVRINVDTSAPGGNSAIAGSSNTLVTTVTAPVFTPPMLDPIGRPEPAPAAPPAAAGPTVGPAPTAGDDADETVAEAEPTTAGGHGEATPASIGLASAQDDAQARRNEDTGTARERETPLRRNAEGGGSTSPRTQLLGLEAWNAPTGVAQADLTRVAGNGGDRSSEMASVLASAGLGDDFDELRRDLAQTSFFTPVVVGSAAAAGSGLSVGYAAWLARGGMLAASLMSSMPAWRIVDPLPVLARMDDEEDESSSDSLHSLISDHENSQAAEVGVRPAEAVSTSDDPIRVEPQ